MDYRQLVAGVVVGLALGVGVSTLLAQEKNSRSEVVMRESLAPTRQASNGKAQITLYAEGEKAFMGKLRIRPGETMPKHTDKSEEYLYVVKGSGTLTVDGTEYTLKPHTGVYLPAGAKVSFENDSRVFEAVQLFAPPESANKYKNWETGQVPMESGRKSRSRGGGSKKKK